MGMSLVSSQNTHRLVQLSSPKTKYSSIISTSAVWSDTDLKWVTGFDMNNEFVFATSPYTGSITRFNLTTGEYIDHMDGENTLEHDKLHRPFDVKLYGNSLLVCGAGKIWRYDMDLFYVRFGEGHDVHTHVDHPGLECSFLLVHNL